MSSEGQKNDNASSGQTKIVIDLDALASEKPQLIKIRTATMKNQKAETNQALTSFAKSLGATLQAAQPAMQFTKLIAEMQKSIAQSVAPAVKALCELGEQMRETIKAVGKVLPSFVEMFRKIGKTISGATASFIKPLLSAAARIKAPPWINIVRNSFGQIAEAARRWVERYFLELYQLILDAAQGDENASIILMRKWHKYRRPFLVIQRLQGIETNKEATDRDFKAYIQESCFLYLYTHNGINHPPVFGYFMARFYLSLKLRQDHRELSRQQRRGIGLDYLPLFKYEGENYLVAEVAAEVAGKTPQTIRNWIKEGWLPGQKISYFSTMAMKHIELYIIPYNSQVTAILRTGPSTSIKTGTSLIAAAELCEQLNISNMCLHRLEKQGDVIPQRIKGKRYYSPNDRVAILQKLSKTSSPRIKKRIPEFNAQLAYYTA